MWSRRFVALTITVEIEIDSAILVPAIEAITGSYPSSSKAAELSYRVERAEIAKGEQRFRIMRDEKLMDADASLLDAPSIIELDLFRQCILWATDCIVLHAAAVAVGDKALVLVGPSGAGKTTLTRALLAKGAHYLSDECVAIRADGSVLGLARPIYLDTAPERAEAERYSVHEHLYADSDDSIVRNLLLHPSVTDRRPAAPTLESLLLISYVSGSEGTRVQLNATESLTRLWPCVFNPGAPSLNILATIVAEHESWAVTSASVQVGCALVAGGLIER